MGGLFCWQQQAAPIASSCLGVGLLSLLGEKLYDSLMLLTWAHVIAGCGLIGREIAMVTSMAR